MSQLMLFLGFSLIVMIALIATEWTKKISFKPLAGLFLFGVLISLPFVLVEHVGTHLKYYFVILAFIAIELGVLFCENQVKYFHELIHHNIKSLRIISFLIIGLGFTYSEISFSILSSQSSTAEMLNTLPLKSAYALLMHTVLTSAASLVHIGNLFAETVFETIFKFVSYYLRITVISVSHFLYVFSVEHQLANLVLLLLAGSLIAFYYIKRSVDNEALLEA